MSFQMVLLPIVGYRFITAVLELCHSRWFYYFSALFLTAHTVLELCHSRWFYYPQANRHVVEEFWNYVIPDGSTT